MSGDSCIGNLGGSPDEVADGRAVGDTDEAEAASSEEKFRSATRNDCRACRGSTIREDRRIMINIFATRRTRTE